MAIKGDFNISSISSSHAKSRPGFSVGALFSTPISDSWNFQPSLLFSLTGTKSSKNHKPDYSASVYSIDAPLLLSYRMGDDDLSLGIDMGPFLRMGISGNYWTDTPEGRIKPDIFDHYKRFNVGPLVGFSIFAYNIYMGCSFQYGLIKPFDNLKGNYYNYNISFGYLFTLY